MADVYLNRDEVCEWLKVSRTTVDRMVARGKLPKPFKLGLRPMWVEGEVQAHIDSQRHAGEDA